MIYVSASVHVDNVVDDKRFDKKKKKRFGSNME